ncbi:hypothetical protein ACEN2J_06970 [Pseudorhodobacter sp. W20_MBD10_FR17]|uniref:hypothetical protein n=1 Tax=Pseudorhodobacter sp. W20_MBD10_FR17 TaxID=3240266 RepID=UPI003F96C27E
MTKIEIEPWEPEETMGKLWHELASRLDAPSNHDGARVNLAQVGGRLAVLFRGLGGNPATEIKAVGAEKPHHRLSFLRRIGTDTERTARASFDGESLRLPESLSEFPAREANAALYLWLTASAAHADAAPIATDGPLAADIAALEAADAMVRNTLENAPGFAALYYDLCAATLALRPRPALPRAEAAIEARIRHALGEDCALPDLPPPNATRL